MKATTGFIVLIIIAFLIAMAVVCMDVGLFNQPPVHAKADTPAGSEFVAIDTTALPSDFVITVRESDYWPDLGYGIVSVYVRYKGKSIYFDPSEQYTLDNLKEKMAKAHKRAEKFIILYKQKMQIQ